MLKHVVIVGGGTAGWLTAGILAADHRAHASDGLEVTLIESPNVPILGVGEGTWPSLRDTLRRIGIDEGDFIRRCSASFKQGSRFDGWFDGSEQDSYFHPFDAPPGEDDVDVLSLWKSEPGASFASVVSAQSRLCENDRAPKQPQTPQYAAVANYAYHLDAPALAELLKEHCISKLGVRHIVDHVSGVKLSEEGGVSSVLCEQTGEVAGDLFVDCSGKKALLISGEMGAGLTDVSDVLFNDRALTIQVPYSDPQCPIPSQTNARAQSAGWVWDIALQNRRGIGYVFSSEFSGEVDAERVLSAYLSRAAPGFAFDPADTRLLKFSSAYRQTPWIKNVVAIGMSQGFVEPLEASAIVMVELSAAMLSDTLPETRDQLASTARRFNQRFSYRWARIVDFLKLHYVLSKRDEPYWQAHRDQMSWPERLAGLLDDWKFRAPSREDFTQTLEIFPAASYAYVLYGMGFETRVREHLRRKDMPERALRRKQDIDQRAAQLLAGLPTNRQLLDLIAGVSLRQVS